MTLIPRVATEQEATQAIFALKEFLEQHADSKLMMQAWCDEDKTSFDQDVEMLRTDGEVDFVMTAADLFLRCVGLASTRDGKSMFVVHTNDERQSVCVTIQFGMLGKAAAALLKVAAQGEPH